MEKNAGKNIVKEVYDFINMVYDKNLGENIEFNKRHINLAYQHLIIKVIDNFVNEIKLNKI